MAPDQSQRQLEPVPGFQLALLATLLDESRRRSSVQLPGSFAYTEAKVETPLAKLFKAGDAHLRLYLTLVMVTRGQKNSKGEGLLREWGRPMHHLLLARALGYAPERREDDPDATRNGTKRVARTMAWLADNNYIELEDVSEREFPKVWVNHWASTDPKPHITVPLGMWRNGWIARMSSPALGVYLALRRHSYGDESREPFFISPFVREGHYQLSASTWERGAKDLKAIGLLETETKVVIDRRSPERPGIHYKLHSEGLDIAPEEVGRPSQVRLRKG